MATVEYDLTSLISHKLKAQFEFYFSDSNYPKDKFLRAKASENDGYIPIALLATFKRIKSISEDIGHITAVLKSIDDLEMKDDCVKRKRPIPEKDLSLSRSVYAKGFPGEETGVSIDTITEVFSKYGRVLSVRQLRTHKEKKLKGCAYIEFSSDEEAIKVIEAKEVAWTPEVKIQISSKSDRLAYIREKNKKSQR